MGVSRDEAINHPNTELQTHHSSAVRVAVRVRPLLHFEKAQKQGECTRVLPPPNELQIAVGPIGDGGNGCGGRGGGKSFTFDATFSTRATQSSLYEECITPLVEAFFEGFNSTIIAYGQTGSGKTYTMGSGSSARLPEEEQGVIPRVISSLFDVIDGAKHSSSTKGVTYLVRCQFLEIYGEDVRDLLDPTGIGSIVTIREGQNGEVNVHGAVEELVHDAEAMLMILERGSLCRKTASTLMNSSSSRSHAIFTVFLEQRIPAVVDSSQGADGGGGIEDDDFEVRFSKFHFVDLAGSERAKRTRAEGQRFKEGVDINKGLLTLGNVISALGDETKRGRVHVPYRDSKLTRMLQDSLGGNSRTLMIACVSPAEANMYETINALRYANRARNIQNKPVVNRDHNSSIICDLKAKVQMLAAEVLRLQQQQQEGKVSGEEGRIDATPPIGGCEIPNEALQELANATPSKSVVLRLSKRQQPSGPPSSTEESELMSMAARALEAKAEVMRLIEELKLARVDAAKLSDTVVSLRAERDVMAMGVDAWEGLAAEASSSTLGEEEDSSGAQTSTTTPLSSSKRKGRRSKLFRFFPLKSENTVLTDEQTHHAKSNSSSTVGGGNGSRRSSEVAAATTDDAKKAVAMSVVKEFHVRLEDTKRKLDNSERQRKALEHQLVSCSALLRCENTTTSSRIARGGGSRSHIDWDISLQQPTIFVRAEEQLEKERKRCNELARRLNGKNNIIHTNSTKVVDDIDDGLCGIGSRDESPDEVGENHHHTIIEELPKSSSSNEEKNCDVQQQQSALLSNNDSLTEGEEDESLDEDRSIASGMGAEELELCAKHQEKKNSMALGELEKGIAMKEELLVALRNNKIKFDAMEHHYKQKLDEMDVEVRRMEADHDKLLEEVKEMEKKSGLHNMGGGTKHTERLHEMLSKKTAELEDAKKRQKELTRLAVGRSKEAARVKGLGEEIVKMKRARIVLQKNLENQRREQADLIQMKAREIANLKRGARKNAGEIARLMAAQHRAAATGRRHLEELSLLRRTLRQKQQRGKNSSTARLKKQELEIKRWVEERMTEAAKKEEQAVQLTAEYEKKLVLLQQKENLELARDSITTRTHGPWSPSVSPSGAKSLHHQPNEDRTTTAKIGAVGNFISNSNYNSTTPSSELLPHLSIEEQETLQEMEERLESIVAELAYKDEKIKSMEKRKGNGCKGSDQSGGGGGGIIFQELLLRANDMASSHSIIRVLTEGLMDAKRAQMATSNEVLNLQDRTRDAEDSLEETREMAAAESRNFDTTLVQLSTDFEKKIGGLLAHVTETAAAPSSDIMTGIDSSVGGDGEVMMQQEAKGGGTSFILNHSPGSANDRALLGLSSERNNTLRGMVRTLESRIVEAMQRCKEVEGGKKEERRKRLEKEQEADWLSFELKGLRKRHLELQSQWEELKLSHSDLQKLKNEGGAVVDVEGTDVNISVNMEENGRLMASYATEGQELFDLENLDEDIAAIAQGKIPESMAMVLKMSQDADGDHNEEQKEQRSVFERLATTTTTSRALKVQDKDHVQESFKRKLGTVMKTKKEHPSVEVQAVDQQCGTGEVGRGGGGLDTASASHGQTILPTSSSLSSDLPPEQQPSHNHAPIPSSSLFRDKEAVTMDLLPPPPPPPLTTSSVTPSSSISIFDRLNDPTSFPVARIQKQRGNAARPLPGRANVCPASLNGYNGGGDPPRNRLPPNTSYSSKSLQSPLTHSSNDLLQQQEVQHPRKCNVFDRLCINITKSEALRQAEVAAKSSCVFGNPTNPTSNVTTPSHNLEGSSLEVKEVV